MSNCPASALTTKVTERLYPHRALRLWPALAIRKDSEVESCLLKSLFYDPTCIPQDHTDKILFLST